MWILFFDPIVLSQREGERGGGGGRGSDCE